METVIEEIAKQLGIAVDQAGQFVTMYLPDYAALKVVQLSAPLKILAVVFVVSLVLAVVSYFLLGDPDESTVCLVSTCVCIIAIIALIVWLLITYAAMQGWQNYPEAMLIDMALSKIGG